MGNCTCKDMLISFSDSAHLTYRHYIISYSVISICTHAYIFDELLVEINMAE